MYPHIWYRWLIFFLLIKLLMMASKNSDLNVVDSLHSKVPTMACLQSDLVSMAYLHSKLLAIIYVLSWLLTMVYVHWSIRSDFWKQALQYIILEQFTPTHADQWDGPVINFFCKNSSQAPNCVNWFALKYSVARHEILFEMPNVLWDFEIDYKFI